MRPIRYVILLIIVGITALPLWAGSDDIVGVWLNQKQDAKIEVVKCGDNYCGKIVWLKIPTYPPDSKEGTPGTAKVDTKNPYATRRKTPIMGMQIMEGFQFAGDNLWNNGKIYDPDNGKTYSAKATLVSHDRLDLRGFVGISLFGRTEKWTRAN